MNTPLDPSTRQRIAGAKAIGILETLRDNGDVPSYALDIVRDVVAEWDATRRPEQQEPAA